MRKQPNRRPKPEKTALALQPYAVSPPRLKKVPDLIRSMSSDLDAPLLHLETMVSAILPRSEYQDLCRQERLVGKAVFWDPVSCQGIRWDASTDVGSIHHDP